MKNHYNISDKIYEELIKKVSVLDLIELVPRFSPNSSPVSKVSLMLIFDKYGNFLEKRESREQIVAKSVFDCLSADDKVALMIYIDGEEDEAILHKRIN